MSRKSKRGKQRATNPPASSEVFFTLASVRMLKDALRLVDETFARNTAPLPNLVLGKETLRGLHQKLDNMLQSENGGKETPFDYNEMHLLYGSVHIYLADLLLARNEQLMPACMQLCKQFSEVIAALPPKELKAPGQ